MSESMLLTAGRLREMFHNAFATTLRPSVCCLSVVSDTGYVNCGYKQCVQEQKLPLTAYRKSYMRNRLIPKCMTLTFE